MADPPYYDPSDPNQQDPNVGFGYVFNHDLGNTEDARKAKAAYNKGVDEQNRTADAQTNPNPRNYMYGGDAGGRDYFSRAYGDTSQRSLAQQDALYQQGAADRQLGLEDRDRALQARQGQLTTADMILARAQGKVPSIAQQQADRQMGQLAAEQTSQAASARGPAALALAQQNQANATATGQSAISGQAQINAAMERERAEQAAMGAYSQMRGQDYQGQQNMLQGQGLAYGAAGQAGQQGLGYSQLQHQVNVAQLQADAAREQQRGGNRAALWAQKEREKDRDDATKMGIVGAVTGGVGGAAQAAGSNPKPPDDGVTSDERAKVPVGRSPGIAPGESYAAPTAYEESRQAAAKVLDDQRAKEAHARVYGTPTPGPNQALSYDPMRQLDAYEQDQVDTLKAKQRHGVRLTAKEQRMSDAMKKGQKYGDQREQQAPPAQSDPAQAPRQAPGSHPRTSEGRVNPGVLFGGAQKVFESVGGARRAGGPAGSYGGPAQYQQITSDMDAKTFAPSVSDERAKEPIGSWGADDRMSSRHRLTDAVRKADDGGDMNGAWVKAMNEQAPHGGQRMWSDMGTKKLGAVDFMSDMGAKMDARMVSDDRAKLAKAWDQGHAAAIANVEKMSRLPASDLKQRAELRQGQTADDESTAAASTARDIKARAWDEGSSDAKALYTAKGRNEAMNAMYEAEKRKAQVEGHRLVPNNAGGRLSGIAARFRRPGTPEYDQANATRDAIDSAQSATVRAAKREQSLDPVQSKGEQLMHSIEDQGLKGVARANVVSDERAKKASSWADAEMAKVKAEDERMSRRPPAVGSQHMSDEAMAQAARSMEASPYAYKPEFKPEEQAPGEVNVGPMAQKMEKSPIAATAVRKDPQTGLRSLDRDKLIKVQGGILASQQRQIDDLKAAQLSKEADRQIGHLRGEPSPMTERQRQMMTEADRQIQNYRADRPAATDARHDAMMRQADEQIQNYRANRPASVVDRGQETPAWLNKYMTAEQELEEEKRTKRRLTSADFITGRRKA